MSDSLEEYRPVRVSVRRLREFLEDHGPTTVATATAAMLLHEPRLASADVEQALRKHPAVFDWSPATGRWSARPRHERIVVWQRPRPVRQPRPRGAPEAPRPSDGDPRSRDPIPADPETPIVTRLGELTGLVVGADGIVTVLESGGRLLVRVPLTLGITESEVAAWGRQPVSSAVHVFQAQAGALPVYRGARELIDAYVPAKGKPAELLLGPASDDRIAVRASPTASLIAPSDGPGLVVLREVTSADLMDALPANLRALASMSPARVRADRKWATNEARLRLSPIIDDHRRWAGFHDWLIQQKPRFDQELIESILVMAANTEGVLPTDVVRLAITLLGSAEPQTASFATTFCLLAAEMTDNLALDFGARCLAVARSHGSEGSDLSRAAAKIAAGQGRHTDACRIYRTLIEDKTLLTAGELETLVLAATYDPQAASRRAAIDALRSAITDCDEPETVFEFRDAIRTALSKLASDLDSPTYVDYLERLLRMAVAERPEEAIGEYKTFANRKERRIRLADRLRLLSVLEDLEGGDHQWALLDLLTELTQDALAQQSEQAMRTLLLQIRLAEEAAGETDHSHSRQLLDRLTQRAHRLGHETWSETARPLEGRSVVLVGGRVGTRSRCVARLEGMGAQRIHQIPPHWEERVHDSIIRAKCADADVVAVLTDETGHDATRNLRKLSETAGFTLVWTQGGPSHVIKAIVERLGR